MTQETDICRNHAWEKLADGSRICFECDERQSPDICRNKHQGNRESVRAFNSIVAGLPFMRAEVLLRIQEAAQEGLTVHELADQLGTTPNAVSGRLTELKKMGRIQKVGTRPTPTGSSAGVYTVSNWEAGAQKLLFPDE